MTTGDKQVVIGIIKRVWLTRGFGFVEGPDGMEAFLHYNDLVNKRDWESLFEGVRVSYIVEHKSNKGNGLRATNVQIESPRETR